MDSHRFGINNFESQSYASNVALNFNSEPYPHSIADFSFLPIDVVKDEMTHLCKETYWIHKLDTLYHPLYPMIQPNCYNKERIHHATSRARMDSVKLTMF